MEIFGFNFNGGNMYIKIENGIIDKKSIRERPKWFYGDGVPVTDEYLRENEGLYPLVDDEPEYDAFYQSLQANSFEDWVVETDRVVRTYTVIDHPIGEMQMFLIGELGEVRWRYESGGMSFTLDDGTVIPVDSSRESQPKVHAAWQSAKDGIRTDGAKWKTKIGFIPLSNAECIRLGPEFLNFVQDCYDRESDIMDMILACKNVEELKAIKVNEFTTGWPSNALYGV